jgi:hypothetical protein
MTHEQFVALTTGAKLAAVKKRFGKPVAPASFPPQFTSQELAQLPLVGPAAGPCLYYLSPFARSAPNGHAAAFQLCFDGASALAAKRVIRS